MPPTVMVVDDNQDELEIMRRVLLRSPQKTMITAVRSGEDAIDQLRSTEVVPALILLDLKMPGMNGIETLRLIRKHSVLYDVPVVIVTNSSLESDEKEAYEAGANDFLHKSISMEQFADDIGIVLDRWIKQ